MELNDHPVLLKSLPFAAAANDDAAGLVFYTEFKEELADIRRCFLKNMVGLQAVHWAKGDNTGFHLFILDPRSPNPERAMITIYQERFHFTPATGQISCASGGAAWEPAQKQEFFAAVQRDIMQKLSDFDHACVNRRMKDYAPDKSPCP